RHLARQSLSSCSTNSLHQGFFGRANHRKSRKRARSRATFVTTFLLSHGRTVAAHHGLLSWKRLKALPPQKMPKLFLIMLTRCSRDRKACTRTQKNNRSMGPARHRCPNETL